ncbi:hypothetical protein HMPREF1344_00610 [Enterococcus faecalis R508]|nr:hypothetical protein HMPREF1344_00610 [Enterococcus faecalis R508]
MFARQHKRFNLKSIPRKEYFFLIVIVRFLQNLEFDIYLFVGLLYD